ncbi:hypothetical protein OAO16_00890 [Opitutales bacterium]|nr:hypothetical protein [Opitutales bacterium]
MKGDKEEEKILREVTVLQLTCGQVHYSLILLLAEKTEIVCLKLFAHSKGLLLMER